MEKVVGSIPIRFFYRCIIVICKITKTFSMDH